MAENSGQNQKPAGEALPKEVIILLCILGAAVATMIAYAMHRTFKSELYESGDLFFNNMGNEQSQYLREVRGRNLDAMGMDRGGSGGGGGYGYEYGEKRPGRGGRGGGGRNQSYASTAGEQWGSEGYR